MPIDPYSPCPGGSGKKIKFCCSDLTAELDKIQRMLDGEQRAACLEHIEALEARYPDRACLLSIKAMLEAQLGQQAKAEATIETFRRKHPENPVALAEQATLAASKEDAQAAVGLLQDALEHCTNEISPQVYDAIGLVAQALLVDGQVAPARAHLMLQIAMTANKDQRALELLGRIAGSPSVPLLLKQELILQPAPDDALWKSAWATAIEPAHRGAWRLAARNLAELAAKVGDWPSIWHNIAVLRTEAADTAGAVEAWRKYAAQNIPPDDAVEAEAMAQLLDDEALDSVDLVTVTYAVDDPESLAAGLSVHPRTPPMAAELARMSSADPNEPPPKGAYWLLDRPVAASGRDLRVDEVSRVVGHALLFGRQTDRPARLELTAYRDELAAAQSAATEAAGKSLGPAGAEEVDSSVSLVQHLLSWNCRLPDDTPAERRLQLVREARARALKDRWPELPQKIFGGKTARQAAADPAMRNKVLAAILILELASTQSADDFDFNLLRENLGLPTLGPIEASQVSPRELPLVRLAHVEVKGLSDDALDLLYRRAQLARHVLALRNLAHELLARPSLEKKIDRAEVWGTLAQIETDPARAISDLGEARRAAEAAKTSTAPWDLAELALRIEIGDAAEAQQLLTHIRDQHVREPGVAQALFQILAEAGIIGPDGKPTAPREPASSIVVPQAAAAESGKIWTPGDELPAAPGKKSALWTPGME